MSPGNRTPFRDAENAVLLWRLDGAGAPAVWLDPPRTGVDRPLTLAELYARRGEITKVERTEEAPSVGQYL